jgi:hypothetical protein
MGFVAVGYAYPGWHPVAWTSADGEDWALQEMDRSQFTLAVSVAVGPDGTIVAVGHSGRAPVSWTSTDGKTWRRHDAATVGDPSVPERMTTVFATRQGFVAGGSAGPELGERHARFWTSPDGGSWTPVDDDAAAFADAEVRSIAAAGSRLVAVGVVGSAQAISGSVAWTSSGGISWARHAAPDLARERTVAVTTAPSGGLVAVGSDLDEREAMAWTSADGASWTIAPSEASRQYPGKIRMTDVTVAGQSLVAVGNYVGVQYGTATAWTSRDGIHWTQARSAPDQEQGEFYAAVAGGPGVIAVGSFGAPDNYIPTVWLSPPR